MYVCAMTDRARLFSARAAAVQRAYCYKNAFAEYIDRYFIIIG